MVRRHGAGLRKIAGRATPPPLGGRLHLSIYSMYYISLHCTLFLLRISSRTFIALSPPCTMLSVQGADCRKIVHSPRPDAWTIFANPPSNLILYATRFSIAFNLRLLPSRKCVEMPNTHMIPFNSLCNFQPSPLTQTASRISILTSSNTFLVFTKKILCF